MKNYNHKLTSPFLYTLFKLLYQYIYIYYNLFLKYKKKIIIKNVYSNNY